jgi:hypothetical protein
MPDNPDEFVVYHSRWKLGLVAAGAMVLAVLSVAAAVVVTLRHDRDVWLAYLILSGGLLFFGSGAIKALNIIKHNVPAVVVNRQGIDERSYLLGSAGFVPWSEIESYRCHQYGMFSMIAVYLYDEQAFLQRQSPLKRFFSITGKSGRGGAVMVVSDMTLSISASELIDKMTAYHQQARRE